MGLSLTWHLCPALLSESIWMDAYHLPVPLTAGEMTPSWCSGDTSTVLMTVGFSPSQVMGVLSLCTNCSLSASQPWASMGNILTFLLLISIEEYLYRVRASHEGGSVYSDWTRGRTMPTGKYLVSKTLTCVCRNAGPSPCSRVPLWSDRAWLSLKTSEAKTLTRSGLFTFLRIYYLLSLDSLLFGFTNGNGGVARIS